MGAESLTFPTFDMGSVDKVTGMFEMTGAEYFALPHISQSFLKGFLDSPFHVKHPRHRESTAEQIFGTRFHELLMEPVLFSGCYVCEPDYQHDGRSKEGKAERAEYFEAMGERLVISKTDWALLHNMLQAVTDDPLTIGLFATGKAEQVLLWQDELGVPCKARLDWLPDSIANLIVDVKTTKCGKLSAIQRSILDWGYHIQDAFYRRGWTHVFGKEPDFIFSFHEKPKHVLDVALPPVVVELDPVFRRAGDEAVVRLIEMYLECSSKNKWPGYTQGLVTISPPSWFKG